MGMILIDLQRTFDSIDLTPTYYLFRIFWINDKLVQIFFNRLYQVHVNGDHSNPGNLPCGVPRDPFWDVFFLYVNDMSQSIFCDLLLYADDSNRLFTDQNFYNIKNNLNMNFNTICDWFVDNKRSLHLGEDKTKSILFSTKWKLWELDIGM